MRFSVKEIDGYRVYFRKDTSDLNTVIEVLSKHCYRKMKIGFDVEPGEKWLDLGANIGAFSLYCHSRKTKKVTCYEPDKDCFELLERNSPWSQNINSAVTSSHKKLIRFYPGKATNFSRGSIIQVRTLGNPIDLSNTYAGSVTDKFDGIKMDIEGSEFGILDEHLLPKCDKLALEYHSSRDSSPKNLEKRLNYLKDTFKFVSYPPELDRLIKSTSAKSFFDRLIFCKERK